MDSRPEIHDVMEEFARLVEELRELIDPPELHDSCTDDGREAEAEA